MATTTAAPVAPDYTKYKSLTDWFKDYIKYWQKWLQSKGMVGNYQTAAYFYLPANVSYFGMVTGLSTQSVVTTVSEVLQSLGINYPQATIFFDIEKMYKSGKDFLDIYNALLLSKENDPAFIHYAGAFKEYRRDIYNALPDMGFKEEKTGYVFDYWDNCESIYPRLQITKDSKRLFFWQAKDSPIFYDKTKAGRFFFEPMFLLPPDDQKSYAERKVLKTIEDLPNFFQLKVMQGNDGKAGGNITKVGNLYYLKVLDHDDSFCFLLQYQINRLMTEPFSTYAQQPGSGTDQTRIGYAMLNNTLAGGSIAGAKQIFATMDYLNVPVYKKNLLDKILLGFTVAVAVALTIVTAGAGSPLLAAAVGYGGKAMISDATTQTGMDDKAKTDLQNDVIKDTLNDPGKKPSALPVALIIVIIVILSGLTYWFIKSKKK